MKMRKERFQKYRTLIASRDEGDLPLAQSKGKHLSDEQPLINYPKSSSIKKEKNEIVPLSKHNWTKSKVFVYLLMILIILFAILGVIMAILK